MVRILEEFPQRPPDVQPGAVDDGPDRGVRRRARRPIRFSTCALKPAEELTEAERDFILRYFFQANPHRMIYRYPRYGELFEHGSPQREAPGARGVFAPRTSAICRCSRSSPGSTKSSRRDDAEVTRLIAQGPRLLARRPGADGRASSARSWRQRAARLPQVRRARPDRDLDHAVLPSRFCRCFAIPISPPSRIPACRCRRASAIPRMRASNCRCAREYIEQHVRRRAGRAVAFGRLGLRRSAARWPRSRASSGPPPTTACSAAPAAAMPASEVTYRPYLWQQQGREMRMIFRDHFLSDLIGFVYSQDGRRTMPPHDFLRSHSGQLPRHSGARRATRWCPSFSTAKTPGSSTTTTAGRSCASCTGGSRTIRSMDALTVSEALRRIEPPQPLDHILPGLLDQRQFRCLDRRRGRQPGLGAACCARGRPSMTTAPSVPEDTPQAGLRGTADRRRQRLVLVVRPGARLRQPRRNSTSCTAATWPTSTAP